MNEILGIAKGAIEAIWHGAHFIAPMAGIGGGMEVRESVDIVPLMKFTAIFVASIAGLFGIGLAMAAKRFAVKIDPRIEEVKGVLAGAHCGACGFPGCEQYAEAVVNNPDVAANLCTPGGARTAEVVAQITGKAAVMSEPIFSRIMCQGGRSKSARRYIYEGVRDCRSVVMAGGGDKTCAYGCLGYGTCVAACPFGAMHMSDDGLPVVDVAKCTGCRKCEKVCPKQVIEVLPAGKAVLVACHSKDKGGDTRKACEVGCIACGKCVKVCPYDAPSIANNLSKIDLAKCKVCGICVKHCPTGAIEDFIPQRPKAFITERCIGCHKCARICPVEAASGELKARHSIEQAKCIGCGICAANCPKQAIEGTFNMVAAKATAQQEN